MDSKLLQAVIILTFFLFLIGLQGISIQISDSVRPLKKKNESKSHASIWQGLHLIAGIFFFCWLATIALLLPSLLELIFNMDGVRALSIHRLIIWFLKAIYLLVSSYGGLRLVLSMERIKDLQRLQEQTKLVPALRRTTLVAISIAIFAYISTAQYFVEINYDTALYHLPMVEHLRKYGPEVGLANFRFSFGFFSLPAFGQTILQSMMPERNLLSPSLNIGFFSAFLLIVFGSIHSNLNSRETIFRIKPLLPIAFATTSLLYGEINTDSLSSYNVDFAVTLTTLSLFFILYFCRDIPIQKWSIGYALLLPCLKLSGLLGLFFLLSYQGLSTIFSYFFKKTSLLADQSQEVLDEFHFDRRDLRFIAVLIAGAYLIMFLTNFILSGYLFFPDIGIGPLTDYAVPESLNSHIKESLVSFYARTDDNADIAYKAFTEKWGITEWFPVFIQTQRGLKILFWLVGSWAIALIISIINLKKIAQVNFHSMALAISMAISVSLAIFVLPPNPRFFSWMGSVLSYQCIELLVLNPIISLGGMLVITCVISYRLERPIVKSVGDVQTNEIVLPATNIRGWRPRSLMGSGDKQWVRFRTPSFTDKCWATDPPCTPHLWGLKNDGKQP